MINTFFLIFFLEIQIRKIVIFATVFDLSFIFFFFITTKLFSWMIYNIFSIVNIFRKSIFLNNVIKVCLILLFFSYFIIFIYIIILLNFLYLIFFPVFSIFIIILLFFINNILGGFNFILISFLRMIYIIKCFFILFKVRLSFMINIWSFIFLYV